MKYDVEVCLTAEAPDTDDEICNGPLEGDMSQTFQRIQGLAEKFSGGWEDWEPMRCTYSFPDKDNALKFSQKAKQGFGNTITTEFMLVDETEE